MYPNSQKQIADKINVAPTTLSRMLKGTRPMSTQVQLKLWVYADPDFTIGGKPADEWRTTLKAARLDKNMAQYALARVVEYKGKNSTRAIGGYEDGTRWPSLDKFRRIVAALGLPPLPATTTRETLQSNKEGK